MPTARPGYLSETPTRTFALGSSDTAGLRGAFSTSPLFNELNDEAIRNSFDAPREVAGAVGSRTINDGGYMFGGPVDRDFQGAPDLSTVRVGGGGLPGSPFGPNIAAPGPASGLNYVGIPESGVAATNRVRGTAGGFGIGNGLTSPSAARATPRRLGDGLRLGVGSTGFRS